MQCTFMKSYVRTATLSARYVTTMFGKHTPNKRLSQNFSNTGLNHKAYIVNNHNEFLEKVMHSENPVIVNFHAEWCEPCKILTPKLNELIDPMNDIDLAVVDVEKNAELVHTFEVKAVPAVIAVRDGVVVDKFIGLVDAAMIENLINKLSKKVK